MAQALLNSVRFGLGRDAVYGPINHPEIPKLTKEQRQQMICRNDYNKLSDPQKIRYFVAQNYPLIFDYYQNAGWDLLKVGPKMIPCYN